MEAGEAKPKPAQLRCAVLAHEHGARLRPGARAPCGAAKTVVDARSAPRFRGEAPEPRPGLPSGHMPGALNLHYDRLADDGRLVPPEKIRKLFRGGRASISRRPS